jgi:sodium-dependent dicarboxylate transporter 2/3/5
MKRSILFLIGGVVACTGILLTPAPEVLGSTAWRVVAVVSLMMIWWISEAVPIAITALLPIVLFPVLNILPLATVTANYGHKIVFLFFGGFTIAIAMKKWHLHTRIALSIVKRTGTHANGIIFGFMLATAFLSMWLSNTATTVMMLPIAASVLALITNDATTDKLSPNTARFALSLMLGIAFAASIGGTATLTGTPPNAILAGILEKNYGYNIAFGTWMMLGVPFAAVMLFICWVMICFVVYPNRLGRINDTAALIDKAYEKLGKISYNEIAVLIVFITTALLWICKKYLPFAIHDAGIAVFAAITLFIIPREDKKGFIMQWHNDPKQNDMLEMPWGILLLFGGGITIASAMKVSGLVQIIGAQITSFDHFGIFGIVLLSMFAALFLTECMSNLALTTIFVPVLAGVAINLGENPLLFVIGGTLAASCAFMLPMATPPNAIVFASGHIRIIQMVKIGIVLNLFSILLITLFTYTLISYIFNIQPATIPNWAISQP